MSPKFAFLDGEFVEWEKATVHITCHAFLYGTAVFGGIRGYWNEDAKQIYILRLPDHYARMHDSARIMLIDIKHSPEELIEITRELIRKNGFQSDVYVRPVAFKNVNPRVVGIDVTGVSDSFCMFALPFGAYVDLEKGLRICTSSWLRIDDNMIPARGKVNGAYVNSALAKSEATMNGFDECIMLTKNGFVAEGSAMNIMIVRNGTIITSPLYDDILEGIVRRSILQIASDLGIPTEVRSIQRTELYVCDEAFFCGTGAQVAPIAEIDHRKIKNSTHPISTKIQKAFFDIVRGRNDAYKHWLTPVY